MIIKNRLLILRNDDLVVSISNSISQINILINKFQQNKIDFLKVISLFRIRIVNNQLKCRNNVDKFLIGSHKKIKKIIDNSHIKAIYLQGKN